VVQSRLASFVVVSGQVLGSPAAWCSSASQVGVVDVSLCTDFDSSISVNLSSVQTQT
jgi:hypothetical protein